jgi:hypothetical protein
MPGAFVVVHRAPIVLAAARNNVPAVYSVSVFVRDGGLLSTNRSLPRVVLLGTALLVVLRCTVGVSSGSKNETARAVARCARVVPG